MRMVAELRTRIKAYFVRMFRTREVIKVFKAAHAQELSMAPVQTWPVIQARQNQEIALIKAGKLNITDRKSWAWPFMPQSIYRMSTPVMKTLPYNLRRMSRTPVPRRAMNLVKNAIINQDWEIRAIDGAVSLDDANEQSQRIKIATKMFEHPNNQDSFQTWCEKGLEDFLLLGSFVAELRVTPDPDRPIKMWAVNTESMRIFMAWSEDTPDMPRYAQMTGLKGERGAILFYDDEILYIKDNESTDNPFGLGCMEVAFQSVNDFLGVQRMSGMAGADQVHKTFLWWEQPQPDTAYQILRRHIQNELEGQSKISIIGGAKKPEVVEVTPVTVDDLLLPWQEMLIRMIANAFNISAMSLNITNDINKAVGQVLDDKDFRAAVVPLAKRMQSAYTRFILHRKLGWTDLEFAYVGLDDPDKETQMDLCSRMYSANAETPNGIRKAMGLAPLDSPFAELTQQEAMIVMAEVTGMIQDQQADHAMGRQLAMSQMMQPPQQPGGPQDQNGGQGNGQPGQGEGNEEEKPQQGGGGGAAPQKPVNLGKGQPGTGTIKLPQMKPTQFPVAGTNYTAAEIAAMDIEELINKMACGILPAPNRLIRAMEQQDPSILEQMSEQVREFLEELAEENNKPQPKTPKQIVDEWRKKQAKLLLDDKRRISNYSEWLYKTGGMNVFGKPNKDIGKPGVPPSITGV